jgi:broad specificity phosphatase PhoE
VLLDSGVRRGVDVLRALALGAQRVLVGRPSSTRSPAAEEGVGTCFAAPRRGGARLRLLGCTSVAEVRGSTCDGVRDPRRHGESVFSARQLVNGDVGVPGRSRARRGGGARARARDRRDPIDLCVTSEFERTRQTADLALEARDVPRLVVPELNDPRYGRFEGGALEEYRSWASRGVARRVPGGGESRAHILDRYVRGFRRCSRARSTVLVVIHSLPIAYVLAAHDGDRRLPAACRWSPMRIRTGSRASSSTPP